MNGDPARFRLASGPGYTMHGDFFNAWPEEEEMAQRVSDRINARGAGPRLNGASGLRV